MSQTTETARNFLHGGKLPFDEADDLWKQLKREDELSLARQVLARIRSGEGLLDQLPADRSIRRKLCQQEALFTSKDLELSAGVRHDRALEVLGQEFDLPSPALDGDGETLGIAGGIHKRRWEDLGQLEDLRLAARYYRRGAAGEMGYDAYSHINAAFLQDLLAEAGDDPEQRRKEAEEMRRQILAQLPQLEEVPDDSKWWNAATRAEAHLGLGEYRAATAALRAQKPPAPWELQTTARQLARLAHMREERPLDHPDLAEFFGLLLGGSAEAARSAFVGKVGLALSGGGFRASFYHLGVLARLAELDVLRHVEVLSCVSGGSIVGACYWLALRRRLLDRRTGGQVDYIGLVQDLIEHFESAVAKGLREHLQASKLRTALRLWRDKGAMDSAQAATALEEQFYRPLMPGDGPLFMDQLAFEPLDHDANLTGSPHFNPTKHNWLRAHKVPVLVLNATTVNTGHAWQFTPNWMGESPWSVHEVADTVPRLEWHWYDDQVGWRMPLGRAVAASACVPGIFSPLRIEKAYEDLVVQLVDGGVYDNQGAAALLAHSCNVVLVSDAAGQLHLERHPKPGLGGLTGYLKRSMDTLMERIRQAAYGDLSARLQSGLLRGLMFLHMKDGLDADPIQLHFSQAPVRLRRESLTTCGIRREFQTALAGLRTDLDAFSEDESRALMACGYRMASVAYKRDLGKLAELGQKATAASWPFGDALAEITSTATTTPRRDKLLAALVAGSVIKT